MDKLFDLKNENEKDPDFLNFKPLTNGLGFHPKKDSSNSPKNRFATNTRVSNFKSNTSSSMGLPSVALPSINTPRPLLKERASFPFENAQGAILPTTENRMVKKGIAFVAWIMDLALVVMTLSLTIMLMLKTSGLNTGYVISVIGIKDSLLYSLYLFIVYYLTYFVFMDTFCRGTIGKQLLKIELFSAKDRLLNFKDCLTRHLLTLFGFVCLGMPNFLDFQSVLSDTRLLKRE